MTQIESAALAWISFAIAGNAIFAIALSSTDSAIPTARFRIAQYLSGSGRPSSAVFIMRLPYAATPARARPDNAATASAHIESRLSNRSFLIGDGIADSCDRRARLALIRLAALATLPFPPPQAGEG